MDTATVSPTPSIDEQQDVSARATKAALPESVHDGPGGHQGRPAEQVARARVGMQLFNLTNHFNPQDVQNNTTARRIAPREQRRPSDSDEVHLPLLSGDSDVTHTSSASNRGPWRRHRGGAALGSRGGEDARHAEHAAGGRRAQVPDAREDAAAALLGHQRRHRRRANQLARRRQRRLRTGSADRIGSAARAPEDQSLGLHRRAGARIGSARHRRDEAVKRAVGERGRITSRQQMARGDTSIARFRARRARTRRAPA